MNIDNLILQNENFFLSAYGKTAGIVSILPDLTLLRHTHPTELEAVVYNPVLCLILQGRKETTVGTKSVNFGQGESLVVGHYLPVVSRITKASPETPYLAVVLSLDLGLIRNLYDQIGDRDLETDNTEPLDVNIADERLINALGRYLELANAPEEATVMGPLILQEIHFRLLMAPNGGMLRRLVFRNSHASRISRSIERIRQDFRTSLSVAELAEVAGMSSSSFHEHFKVITGTTPLQYLKEMRLLKAHRLLQEGAHSVTSTAFEVGYESATQFSREYGRKFGVSPRQDLVSEPGQIN